MIDNNYRYVGPRIPDGKKLPLGIRKYEDLTFLVGRIKSIDENKWTMTVEMFDQKGTINSIGITQPYAGTSSYIAAMPEVGSIVILGSQRNFLWPITYLPNYYAGLDSRTLQMWPDSVGLQEKNVFFYNIKKLNQGELAFGSSKHSEIFLGDSIDIESQANKITVSPFDNSIHATSLSNFVFANGIWCSRGSVRRNSLVKEKGYARRDVLKDGRTSYLLKPEGQTFSSRELTEYLIEVDDYGLPFQQSNDINGTRNRTRRNPIAIFALGNLVGNNIGADTYAEVLGISLFKDKNDEDGDLNFTALTGDEYLTRGLAISLFKPDRRDPKRGAFFGVDKEGHFYQYIPSATASGLGRGRSMSILAKGNKKEIWGADASYGNAWDLALKGGLKWVVGNHNDRNDNPYKKRSMDVRTSSSVFFKYGYTEDVQTIADLDRTNTNLDNISSYKKIELVQGNERKEVTGKRETVIGGRERLEIGGARQESVAGSSSIIVGADYNLNVNSVFTVTVNKEKQETFGSRKTRITSGSSELIIQGPKGDITEQILVTGNKRTTLTKGNIEETIITGNRKLNIGVGNYGAVIGKGNISASTASGNVSIETKSGKMELKALQNIDIKTNLISKVTIKGGSIALKGRTPAGGVITTLTHRDYITGAPLIGSFSVTASS